MAYSDQTDLELAAGGASKLVQLTDHQRSGALNSTIMNKAREAADSTIDGYARRMHSVPFDPVPTLIRHLSATEAVYVMKLWLGMTGEDDDAAREKRIEVLRDIASGKVNPVESDPYPVGQGGGAPGAFSRDSDTNAVSRENLKGFA